MAVFTCPIGLVALMYHNEDEVIVEIDAGPRGGTRYVPTAWGR